MAANILFFNLMKRSFHNRLQDCVLKAFGECLLSLQKGIYPPSNQRNCWQNSIMGTVKLVLPLIILSLFLLLVLPSPICPYIFTR